MTCSTGSVASWTAGKAKTPTRAPHLNEKTSDVARHSARQTAPAQGASASAPPTNVITAFPPRKPV
jgi:hypothetical protein